MTMPDLTGNHHGCFVAIKALISPNKALIVQKISHLEWELLDLS